MKSHPSARALIAVASLSALASLLAATPACNAAAVVKGTWLFDNTFAAQEAAAPALTPVDPTGLSSFSSDTVLGETRTVWNFFCGANPNGNQAGLTLATSGLLDPQTFSVDLVFKFNDRANAWRRILDTQNRASDNGLYVDPANHLDIFPIAGSSAGWTNGVYHHIVVTVAGNEVNAYLDGVSELAAVNTSVLNLDANPSANPDALLGLFLDNVSGFGQGEWSSGSIALARVWDGALTPADARTLATNPFAVPEPSMAAAFAPVALLMGRRRR